MEWTPPTTVDMEYHPTRKQPPSTSTGTQYKNGHEGKYPRPAYGGVPRPSAVYICIDVECFRPREWQSVGIVVAEYPGGQVIGSLEVGIPRSTALPEACRSFWDDRPESFAYNVALGAGKDQTSQEEAICAFVGSTLDAHPDAFILSDNPTLDVAVLDEMFVRNRGHTVLVRGGRFYPAIDAWTVRSTVQRMLGRRLVIDPACTRPVTDLWRRSNTAQHTPMCDAARILSRHFATLDSIAGATGDIFDTNDGSAHRRRVRGRNRGRNFPH